MLTLLAVIAASAVSTAVTANLVITIARSHQERGCERPAEAVLRDALNVSLDVREFTRQLGGQA